MGIVSENLDRIILRHESNLEKLNQEFDDSLRNFIKEHIGYLNQKLSTKMLGIGFHFNSESVFLDDLIFQTYNFEFKEFYNQIPELLDYCTYFKDFKFLVLRNKELNKVSLSDPCFKQVFTDQDIELIVKFKDTVIKDLLLKCYPPDTFIY